MPGQEVSARKMKQKKLLPGKQDKKQDNKEAVWPGLEAF